MSSDAYFEFSTRRQLFMIRMNEKIRTKSLTNYRFKVETLKLTIITLLFEL